MPLTSKIKQITEDGVYAYISLSDGTTCTNADQYYFLQGTFENEIMQCWEANAALSYCGCDGNSNHFEVDINASFESDTGNNLITLALFKNGALQLNSEMSIYIKNTAEVYSVSLVDVILFAPNDYTSIKIKSSQAGAVVTAQKMTASLHRFYR